MRQATRRATGNEPNLGRGYVHVYTGEGKGKTTAALGLALRAIGNGLRVALVTFMKNRQSGEFKALEQISGQITIVEFGSGCFVHGKPEKNEVLQARRGYRAVRKMMDRREYDLIILDEANMAVCCGLLSVKDLLTLILDKPDGQEMAITGRYAHPEIIAAADLVTEMREVKHYFQSGVQARPGIDM